MASGKPGAVHSGKPGAVHIVFDGPPGPTSCCFVEVEDDNGKSVDVGPWRERVDGFWELRISAPATLSAAPAARPGDGVLAHLRAQGWAVAVHNDYRLAGEARTFWLLTHANGRWIKGEGRTDDEALAEAALSTAPATRPGDEVAGWLPVEQFPPRTKALFGRWTMYGTAGQSDEHWEWQEAAGTYHDFMGERFWNLDGRSFAGAPFYGKAPTHAWPLPTWSVDRPVPAAAPAADGGRA